MKRCKKRKVLSMLLVLTIMMSVVTVITPLSVGAATQTKTVTLLEDNFSGESLNAGWELQGKWGTSNLWRLNKESGTLYDYQTNSNWTIAARQWDVTNLPDEYELNVKYKVQADFADGNVGLVTSLADFAHGNESYLNTTAVATVSLNGDKFGTAPAGFYYTNTGDGVLLYGEEAGYVDDNWYTVSITAHIDGVNNATFDYKIYNKEETTLLAEISNVSTSSYAGSVIEPTYISFTKYNGTGLTTSASIDDVLVTATYEKLSENAHKVNLFSDDFSTGAYKDGWMKGYVYPNNQWGIGGDSSNYYACFNQGWGDCHGFIATKYSVDSLPDEYELHISYKAKSDYSGTNGKGFITYLGGEELYGNGFQNYRGTDKRGTTVVMLNQQPDGVVKQGVYYMPQSNWNGVEIYGSEAGYDASKWHTYEITGYINGTTAPTYDIRVLDETGTTLLGEVKGIQPHNSTSVIEPTVLQFARVDASDAKTACVDDVEVYAYWEEATEQPPVEELEENLTIESFAWYKGETEIKDLSELADGENNLTLKVSVLNKTGEEKALVLGFAAYKNRYLMAVNFTEEQTIGTENRSYEVSLPVTVTKSELDKLSGFVWENLVSIKPLANVAEID